MAREQRVTPTTAPPVPPTKDATPRHEADRAGDVSAPGAAGLTAGDARVLQRLAGNSALAQLLARRPAPGSAGAPPSAVERDAVHVQRHASFEHRMLGDVPPADLFALGAQQELGASGGRSFIDIPLPGGGTRQVVRSNLEHILEQELKRLQVWQQQDPKVDSMAAIGNTVGAAKARLETDDPTRYVRVVAIESSTGGQPLLVTYGELNTLADFYGSVDELKAADATKRRNVVQSVRAQSYDKLLELYTKVVTGGGAKEKLAAIGKKPDFKGSFGISSILDEVGMMAKDKKGALGDTTAYKATLGRNACHFAPESWHSWEDHHHKALGLARESFQAMQAAKHGTKSEKLNEALLYNGFGDHYLQDSYAAGHLVNKTQIMQMYVRYQDQNDPMNSGWATPATWRSFQELSYNQRGITSRDQYKKDQVGRRSIGGQDVSTAKNPQAVENTQDLGGGFDWEDRFEMLGLRLPTSARPGTPAFKLLVWMQRQHGVFSRYDVNFDRDEVMVKRGAIGLARDEVGPAIRQLLNDNILYKVEGVANLGESRPAAGSRLLYRDSTSDGSFTLRKEWVVSRGAQEKKFDAATTPLAIGGTGGQDYQRMGKAAIYRDYVRFMQDAYLQKATNALHDEFCKSGLWVASAVGEPLFKIYGDNAMLNAESAAGVQHSAVTANMSRDSVLGMATTGQEPAGQTTADILARFPNAVRPPGSGRALSLADWHNNGTLEAWAGPNVFAKMSAVINAGAGASTLGKITKDQDVHGGEAF
jgi:hypothetical protein